MAQDSRKSEVVLPKLSEFDPDLMAFLPESFKTMMRIEQEAKRRLAGIMARVEAGETTIEDVIKEREAIAPENRIKALEEKNREKEAEIVELNVETRLLRELLKQKDAEIEVLTANQKPIRKHRTPKSV